MEPRSTYRRMSSFTYADTRRADRRGHFVSDVIASVVGEVTSGPTSRYRGVEAVGNGVVVSAIPQCHDACCLRESV